MQNWAVLIASLLLSGAGVYGARALALRSNWLDRPNERSFHTKPVPRSGGLGMLLPVFLLGIWLGLAPVDHHTWVVPWSLAFFIAILSYVDDRIELSRALRFAIHGLVAIFVLWMFGEGWAGKPVPLFGTLLPEMLVGILLFLWIAGLINAYNFMDGTDGIAGVVGIMVCFGYATLVFGGPIEPNYYGATGTNGLLLLCLIGALAAFLVFNWSPASIFLGDSGSTFLGAFFAILPFALAYDGLPLAMALEAGFLFIWPFIFDAVHTFCKRAYLGERVFSAHRKHVYQLLAASYESREQGHRMVAVIYGILVLIGIGLFWSPGPFWAKLAVCGWLWLALAAWTYGMRVPMTRAREEAERRAREETSAEATATLQAFEIYLNPPDVGLVEESMVRKAFDSGFVAPVGPQLDEFERELALFLGMPEVHAVNSGTSAIHLCLRAMNVGPGDVVICPDFTFVAAVNPVRYLGAEPVLVDVEPATWAMDPKLLQAAIDDQLAKGRRIAAIVIVHPYGIPAPMHRLMPIADKYGIPVLEDCAGAIGSRFGGEHVGKRGVAAAFSFNGNKVLTTGGGGALAFADKEKLLLTRSWANQGKPGKSIGYVHSSMGYNYKLSNVLAAIGLGQLATLPERRKRKTQLRRWYEEALKPFPEIEHMPDPDYGERNDWLTAVRLPEGVDTMRAVLTFRRDGIEASPMWTPLHMMGYNSDLKYYGGEAGRQIYERFICLPSGTQLRQIDVQRICAHFASILD